MVFSVRRPAPPLAARIPKPASKPLRRQHYPLYVAEDTSFTTQSTEESVFSINHNQDRKSSAAITHSFDNRSLSRLQALAAPIVQSFHADTFDPVPWLSNRHIQTIAGCLVRGTKLAYLPKNNGVLKTCERLLKERNKSVFVSEHKTAAAESSSANVDPDTPPDFWDDRERIHTPDKDWFHVDTKYSRHPTADGAIRLDAPIVLLLHGLESSSESGNCQEMAISFNRQGMHCVCLNFRGCSGTPNDTLGAYHLGFTDDVKFYLEILAQQCGGSEDSSHRRRPVVYLAGFSLGANAVLKCLGELGADAVTKWNIAGAAVECAPLDQARNSVALGKRGINRCLYTNYFLKLLKRKTVEKWKSFCQGNEANLEAFDFERAVTAKTVSDFEAAFIAPIYGFDDCNDYYRQISSLFFLDQIAVPTLLLNAFDDPLFDPSVWPVEKSVNYGGSLPLKMVRMNKGGHLGFFFHQVNNSDDVRLTSDDFHPSWAASELGRFLGHVQESSVDSQEVQV